MELGEKVRFRTMLVRQREQRATGGPQRATSWKVWTSRAISDDWVEGVIVGRRTLVDGELISDSEVGNQFLGRHWFPAYLVSYALNRKPVLVPPECLEPVE